MLPVYKVNNLQRDNIIKDIYVFTGFTKEETRDLTNTFLKQKTHLQIILVILKLNILKKMMLMLNLFHLKFMMMTQLIL